MKRRSRTSIVTGALAVVTLAIAGCSSSGSHTGGGGTAKKSPYVIGATDDLSGLIPAFGAAIRETWQGAFDAVNAAGGINGHPIKFILLDDKSNVSTTVQNVRQLISSDNALVVTGSTISDNCAAARKISGAAKVAQSCLVGTKEVVEPVDPYVYLRLLPESLTATPIVSFIANTLFPGKSDVKVATAVVAPAGSQQLGSRLKDLIAAKGWTLTTAETIATGSGTSIDAQASKIAASHPDVVVDEPNPGQQVGFDQALRNAGFTGPIIDEEADYPGLQSSDGKLYELWNHEPVASASPAGAGASAYVKAMASQHVTGDADINGQITDDYLAAEDIIGALRMCGDKCTRASVSVNLQKYVLKLPGLVDNWGYTSSRHYPVTSVSFYNWDVATKKPALVAKNVAVTGS